MSMMNEDLDTTVDDDANTEGQDRGDVVDTGTDNQETEDAGGDKPPRDEKGRFTKEAGDNEEGEDKDEEDEGEGEGEEEGEGAGDDKNLGIRLNKAKEQRDAARREAEAARREAAELKARLESQSAPQGKEVEKAPDPTEALQTKLDSLYEQVEEARLDGDTKLAAQLQREIDASNRDIARLEAERAAFAVGKQTSEAHAFNALLDSAEAAYPVLNPKDADNFDPNVVKQVEFYIAAHEKMGMNPVDALRATINLVFRDVAPVTDAPAVEDKAGKKAAELKAAGVKKALDTGKKQPPDTARRGVNSEDKAVEPDALSDEEWDALPASKKKAMRGDLG